MRPRREPPPADGPRQRYQQQIRLGAEPALALAVVASSYGLDTNIVILKPDGSKTVIDRKWTLAQIERLVALKWEYEHGLAGGPFH